MALNITIRPIDGQKLPNVYKSDLPSDTKMSHYQNTRLTDSKFLDLSPKAVGVSISFNISLNHTFRTVLK